VLGTDSAGLLPEADKQACAYTAQNNVAAAFMAALPDFIHR